MKDERKTQDDKTQDTRGECRRREDLRGTLNIERPTSKFPDL
jgi:hypothetical protein